MANGDSLASGKSRGAFSPFGEVVFFYQFASYVKHLRMRYNNGENDFTGILVQQGSVELQKALADIYSEIRLGSPGSRKVQDAAARPLVAPL